MTAAVFAGRMVTYAVEQGFDARVMTFGRVCSVTITAEFGTQRVSECYSFTMYEADSPFTTPEEEASRMVCNLRSMKPSERR